MLRQVSGFRFAGDVDQVITQLLMQLDGQRCLGEAVGVVAQHSDYPVAELKPVVAQVVRALVAQGFLQPGSTPSAS